ncbi:Tetratricopeptide repeat-containing protein [Chryseobacterium soldanellicola]|uniref:Tetratricopeptide repeat-containing protein n=1 Tax=Chryseobacterium soldanellicola TaxID=311333 RepID=A0A1H1D4R3_9FLAO|nr:hypothetical protein [Chryseobacterium soldanellicola]SDQ71422.1 Tetratricopeptide repeat-containing protein [Chryseobacterium soldanellicola]
MKLVLKFIITAFFICQASLYGQKISDDSLLKKARLEIYGNPDISIRIANQLLKKEKDINKSISIYMLLSTANIAKRNFDESLKYILKAKELAQKTNDLKIRANVLVSVAIQYQQMELFSKSFETLNEADVYIEKLPQNADEKYIETARSYAIRGMIYKSQSNSEIALEKFLVSIKNFEKAARSKPVYANMSVVYYNIGYCYINLNLMQNANEAFIKSISYAQKATAKSLEAFALKGMAEMYKQNGENVTALHLLSKAENLSKKTGDLVLNEGIYKEMADNYLALGKQNLYQYYHKKYFESLFKREQNELSSINHSIDNHNKETLKKIREMGAHYQYLRIIIGVIGLIIIVLLLYFILKIRKQNLLYQKEIQKLIRS